MFIDCFFEYSVFFPLFVLHLHIVIDFFLNKFIFHIVVLFCVSFFSKDVLSQGSTKDCWRISINTYPFDTYLVNKYPFNTYPFKRYVYPFHSYPFKRYASAGMAMSMSIISTRREWQCVSIQYVSIQKVCISRNGNEYEYHYYAAGMAIKKHFSFNFFATLLIEYQLYRARTSMEFIANYRPACLLACCLLVRLRLNYFLFL